MAKSVRSRSRGRPVNETARRVRRARILTAARGCFAAKGFHAASTADIARAARLSVANLYQYFASKEDLVMALVEQDLEGDVAFVVELGRSAPFARAVEGVLRAVVEERVRDEDGFRLRLEILTESTRNAAVRRALASAEARVILVLAGLVREAQANGEVGTHESPEAIARLLYALADGVASGVGVAPDVVTVARLVARALAPGGAPGR
ncbi:TetR/AcrR family transcriptional regulator [Opitutales bacterium ASA1]|uniref:TetR/AcrR family transcriptional regulator n=1 Tax=Congregicoccus parvus TaxID=3081749 RepID=UPI002B2AA6C9|nr:TetR/AcrR family transcriptional regulator [Opitutales bacterium ASA1]